MQFATNSQDEFVSLLGSCYISARRAHTAGRFVVNLVVTVLTVYLCTQLILGSQSETNASAQRRQMVTEFAHVTLRNLANWLDRVNTVLNVRVLLCFSLQITSALYLRR